MDVPSGKQYERKTARRARTPARTPRISEASTSTTSSQMYGDVRKEVSEWSLFSFRNTQSLSSLPSSKSGGGYGNFDRNAPSSFASRKSSNTGELSIAIEPSSPVDDDFLYGDMTSVNSKGSRSPSQRSLSPVPAARSPSTTNSTPSRRSRGASPVPFGAILKEVKLLNDELNAALLSHEKAQDVLAILAEYTEGLSNDRDSAKIYAELFKESGTIELLVETQRTHSHVSAVQVIAGRAIQALAQVHANIAHEIGVSGGIQLIFDSLRHHSDDDTFVQGIEYALKALAKLMVLEKNRDTMADCNGMEVIISIMGRYSDTPIIQSTGAEIISLGVVNCERNVDSIITGFGLDVLITSMRGLPKEWKVQKWACTALYNISISISSISNSIAGVRDNSESIGRKGGVNAIIEALAIHHNNLQVVTEASKALHSLVSNVHTNLERMSNSSEWTHVLISILGKYENESNIQVWLLGILGNAISISATVNDNDNNVNDDNNSNNNKGKQAAYTGVRNKGKYNNIVGELIANGAIQVAINGMRRNLGDSAVLAAGAKTARYLLNNSSTEGHKEMEAAIKQVGGITTLIDLLIQAANNNTLQPPTSSVTTEQTNNDRRIGENGTFF